MSDFIPYILIAAVVVVCWVIAWTLLSMLNSISSLVTHYFALRSAVLAYLEAKSPEAESELRGMVE